MTRFWWVRHGPTHARGMVGWTDLAADLSDTAQLARLSMHLPADAPVISSDLGRAVTTADAIANGRRRLPHDPDLRELNFGAWEGRRFDEVEAEDAVRIRAFYEQPGTTRAPDGECWDEVCTRVHTAVERLLARKPPDIVVVAHMGTILTQLQRALRLTAYQAFGHRIDNLAVTRITFDGAWSAGPVNHLP